MNKFVSVILLVAALGIAPSQQAFTRTFGKPCKVETDCTSRTRSLECTAEEQICRCLNPDSMIYNNREDACVSIEGGLCSLSIKNEQSIRCMEGLTCVQIPGKILLGKCMGLTGDWVVDWKQGDEILEDTSATASSSVQTVDPGNPGTGSTTTADPGNPGTGSTTTADPGNPGTGSTTTAEPGNPGTGSTTTAEPGNPGTGSTTTAEPGNPGTRSTPSAATGNPGDGSTADPGNPGDGSTADPGVPGTSSTTPADDNSTPDSSSSVVASLILLICAQIVIFL